ncbi:hypothetical protein CAPTEDRAFT_209296 [Capitella teleta]|uniref:F5/8 type C domain-containing protein n=1 Tax=Capitella teleta TaxID=283909 RepID=R7VLX4_CAPTE|nr:hypothetical protein CAPTEDRAFT_209296 [Capitella teleta]|eukprot:ELU18000.1 hypothetical protein CAPTEDRAFT_209296 [Capitella teleta]
MTMVSLVILFLLLQRLNIVLSETIGCGCMETAPLINGLNGVEDDQLSASSVHQIFKHHVPAQSRMDSEWKGWICDDSDEDSWLQVDFKIPKEIMAIETRGREEYLEWTVNYKLTWSEDSLAPWSWYTLDGEPQVPGSLAPPTPADISDDDITTCVRVPPSNYPPGELIIQLQGYKQTASITTVSLRGTGIQCLSVSAMVQESRTESCSGMYMLCSVAEGADDCRVTCSSELHTNQMFSMQISLTTPAHTDARLCEAKRVD